MSAERSSSPRELMLERVATTIDLFRFSAATWNAHRIHYDHEQALAEGLPGTVVQAHLVGAWLLDLVDEALGPDEVLTRFAWRNIRPILPETAVTLRATAATGTAEGGAYELSVTDPSGDLCATGRAEVRKGVSS